MILCLAIIGQAATFVVTKTSDTNDGICDSDCSLREALSLANAAPSDDTIQFDMSVFGSAQTIVLANELLASNNGSLTISGPSANLLSISGNNSSRVFQISLGATVHISDLKITGGSMTQSPSIGGGVYNNGGTLSLTRCIVTGNKSSFAGGGITSHGSLTILDSDISNNSTSGEGGGLRINNGTASITNSTIRGNAGLPSGIKNSGNLTITNSTISDNTGNGIINDAGTLTVINSTIAANGGTGLQSVFGGTATITGSTISGNLGGPLGGGVYCTGTVNIESTLITGNSASRGAGVQSENGTVNVSNSRIIGNNATSGGGGMYIGGGHANINATLIANNTADNSGGGIVNESDTTITVSNSTITGNAAGSRGGGANPSGSATFTNVTISYNTASLGGGVSTTGNTTNVQFRNTIIGDNSATTGGADFDGSFTSLGFNLVENLDRTIINGSATGDILGHDPQLVPLRDNGGPTNTIALQATSPAIDAADPANFPASDQRGIGRAQDGDLNGDSLPDIGAYERQVVPFTVTKIADTNDGVCDGDCSLREAIAASSAATSLDKAVIFDPGVFQSPQTIVLTNGEITVSNTGTLGIYGPGASLLTISGNNASRILMVATGAVVGVSGVSFINGNGSGAFFTDSGGAIFTREAILSIRNCIISGNSTSSINGRGGGIYNYRGSLRIIGSAVSDNSAFHAGGIYNSNFGGLLDVVQSTISNNSAGFAGGVETFGTASFATVDFKSNTVTSAGGALYMQGDLLNIKDSTFANNSASSGGAIYSNSGNTNISNTLMLKNLASSDGGAIRNLDFSSITLTGSIIRENNANRAGGGIDTSGVLNVSNSTIFKNTASLFGGGIKNSGSLSLVNSTISRNSSNDNTWGGGGIFNEINGSGSLTATNSTIAFNSAPNGGGVFNNIGTVNMRNTLVSGNTAAGVGPDFKGMLTSQGYNLIENTDGATITGATMSNILGQDPLLDPVLRLNGALTLTHALSPNSPVLDQGSSTNPPTPKDQRGRPRPFDFATITNASFGNGSDIGAYERNAGDVFIGTPFDYDGDGRSDLSVRRPSDNVWYLQRGTAGYTAMQFGEAGDRMAPADYDGDGKTDVAVFRPSNGTWYIYMSQSQTFQTFGWGQDGDLPVPTDRDADGKTDLVIFRPSNNTWYTRFANGTFNTFEFGVAGDKPVVGDFDGDGKGDIALYRPSNNNWYLLKSNLGFFVQTWGEAGDQPITGDFDGDGATDQAVFRPSTGTWYLSRTTAGFSSQSWGQAGDIPVAADYDGDGKTDVAVFRPSNGQWYIVQSGSGILVLPFGQDGDVPTQSAFNY